MRLKPSEPRAPRVLIISADKNGHVNQCLALCEMMQWEAEKIIRIPGSGRNDKLHTKLVTGLRRIIATRSHLPRSRKPGRIVIVTSGSSPLALLAKYRSLYRTELFAIAAGNPRTGRKLFDYALVSTHWKNAENQDLASANQTLWIPGVLVRQITAKAANGQTSPVVLIGGTNKAFHLEQSRISEQLTTFVERGSLAHAKPTIVFSRRTPLALEAEIRKNLPARELKFIDRNDRKGFELAMASASNFLVTPDSITMICEACATGKPVEIFDLPFINRNSSTARFVDIFTKENRVSLLSKTQPKAPRPYNNELQSAINTLKQAFEKWQTNPTHQPQVNPQI